MFRARLTSPLWWLPHHWEYWFLIPFCSTILVHDFQLESPLTAYADTETHPLLPFSSGENKVGMGLGRIELKSPLVAETAPFSSLPQNATWHFCSYVIA